MHTTISHDSQNPMRAHRCCAVFHFWQDLTIEQFPVDIPTQLVLRKMEGFVTKRGHLITNWKVRWFVLEDGAIKYYQDRTLQKLKGTYLLHPDTVVTFHSDMGLNRHVILLFTTSHPFRKRALYFSCDSAETKEAWMAAVTKDIEELKLSGKTPVQAPLVDIAGSVDKLSNTIARIFTGEKADSDEASIVPVTSPTAQDEEEVRRGRPKGRPVSTGHEQASTISATDSVDRGRAQSAKATKPVTKNKRLPNTTAGQAGQTAPSTSNRETETPQYIATEYDTSDTDNSDNGASGTRGKSSSDAPRVRMNSVGHSQGPANAFAMDAANSPILNKVKEKQQAPQTADDMSLMPRLSKNINLPRVSQIVADEAAQATNKKLNFNNSSAKNVRPTGTGAAATTSSSSTTAANMQESNTPPRKKSSFTADSGRSNSPYRSTGASGGTNATNNSSAGTESPNATKDKRNGSFNAGSAAADSENPWIEAYTAEGELYYYHKVTRLARWDKPDQHIAEAVESRMKDIDQAAERSLKDRMEAMEKTKQREQETASIKSEKTSEIEKTVVSWSKDKQKAGRELSFPELLRDLVYVLPSDLLLIVYDSNHKVILDALQDFTINSNPTEVKKAYLRVVRFVHPDKLPPDLDTASKLLVERVFIHLTQKYDIYRKAHELG